MPDTDENKFPLLGIARKMHCTRKKEIRGVELKKIESISPGTLKNHIRKTTDDSINGARKKGDNPFIGYLYLLYSQVRFFHIFIYQKVGTGIRQGDNPILHNISPVGGF